MPSPHRDAWSPFWVITNTLATAVAACTGVIAIIIAIIAILRS